MKFETKNPMVPFVFSCDVYIERDKICHAFKWEGLHIVLHNVSHI